MMFNVISTTDPNNPIPAKFLQISRDTCNSPFKLLLSKDSRNPRISVLVEPAYGFEIMWRIAHLAELNEVIAPTYDLTIEPIPHKSHAPITEYRAVGPSVVDVAQSIRGMRQLFLPISSDPNVPVAYVDKILMNSKFPKIVTITAHTSHEPPIYVYYEIFSADNIRTLGQHVMDPIPHTSDTLKLRDLNGRFYTQY